MQHRTEGEGSTVGFSRVKPHGRDFAINPEKALGQEKKVHELYLKEWFSKRVPRGYEEKSDHIKLNIKFRKHRICLTLLSSYTCQVFGAERDLALKLKRNKI